MIKQTKLLLAAVATSGAITLFSGQVAAMPAAPKDFISPSGAAVGVDQAHAVWVCRNGRCWWSRSGHRHGGYGYGYGYRGGYGWGRPYYRGRGWHGHGHGWGWHGGGHGHGWRRHW